MWDWLESNAVWLFIGAAFVMIAAYVIRAWVRRCSEAHAVPGITPLIRKFGKVSFWIFEAVLLSGIMIAFTAVIISREGVGALITGETIQQWLLQNGVAILVWLLVGIGLWFILGRVLPPLVLRTIHRPKRGESMQGLKRRADTLVQVFMGLGKALIVIIIMFMILGELNVEVGPILAGFGIVGIAVGFGAQFLIRDLIAGVFILMENQYRVGDVVGLGEVRATVEAVNLRKTVLRDLDGILHHVPNGEIKIASNYTRHFARVKLDMPVAYGTDLDHAIGVINRVGQELADDPEWGQYVITPPQVLRVNKFGDSGIDIRILGDCKPLEQWSLTGQLRLRLKKAFDEAAVEIPWPHVKVYYGGRDEGGTRPCAACAYPNPPQNNFCAGCGEKLAPEGPAN